MSLLEIAHILQASYGGEFPFPRWTLPKMIVSLLAPLRGIPRRVIKRNVRLPSEIRQPTRQVRSGD